MTDRNGNTPWELPKDGNQWGSPDSSGYGWRFPFRDDELDNNGPDDSETAEMPVPGATPAPAPDSSRDVTSDDGTSNDGAADDGPAADEEETREMPANEPVATDPEPPTDTRPEPAYTAPADTGAEHHPSSGTDPANAPSPEAGTRETASKPRGIGKGAVAALGVGVAIVAAAAGFGGGWFLQQPKIDKAEENYSSASNDAWSLEKELKEAKQNHADSESSLEENYKNALTASNGWPICNIDGYTSIRQSVWHYTSEDLKGLITPLGVGCNYTNGNQIIFVTSGRLMDDANSAGDNAPKIGSHSYDKTGYRFIKYIDDGIWITVQGPDERSNEQTAKEVEGKLRTLKDQTPES